MRNFVISLSEIKTVLLFVLTFVFIFPPPLDISGELFHLKNPIAFFLIFLFLFYNFKSFSVIRDFMLFACYLIFLFILSVIIFMYHGKGDAYGIQTVFWGLVFFIAAFMVVELYKKRYGELFVDKLLYHIILVGFAHSLLIYLLFISEPLRQGLYEIIYSEGVARLFIERNFRLHGIRTGGGADLSIIHGFFFVLTSSFIYFKRKVLSFKQITWLVFVAIVIFFSNIFIGRTGFVISLFGLGLLFIYTWLNDGKVNLKIIKSFLVTLFIVLTFIILFILTNNDLIQHFNERIVPQAFELIINLVISGDLETGSTNKLFRTMFFLPQETMLGIGNFGRDKSLQYISSDVGYIRFIHGGGFIFTLFFYIFYLLIIIYALLKTNISKLSKFMLIYLSITVLIVNIKEVHNLATIGSTHFIFLVLSIAILENKYKVKYLNNHKEPK